MDLKPQTRFVLYLHDGPPSDVAKCVQAVMAANAGLLNGEALQTVKSGSGLLELRLEAGRASQVQHALTQAGFRVELVELKASLQRPPQRALNDVHLDATHCRGLTPEGPVALPWSSLVAVSAGRVKSQPMHSLDEATSTEEFAQDLVSDALDLPRRPGGHDPRLARLERAEARAAATPPEPNLDLFFKTTELAWLRVPLTRLRFAGAGLAPTARKNVELWLAKLHAGATGARYSGEVTAMTTRLEVEKWPVLEPHVYERFARWVRLKHTRP